MKSHTLKDHFSLFFFFSSRRRHTRYIGDWSSDVCSSDLVSRAAHSGWEDLVFLIGLISVAIGFFNILPVPLLDGGHAAMYVWEGVSGKPLTKDAMAKANGVGIAFLLSLLVFATYNDLRRIHHERSITREAPAAEQPTP